MVEQNQQRLQLELSSSPMTPLGVISDRVASPHPNPLWDGTILFHLFSKLLLDFERLLRRHDDR